MTSLFPWQLNNWQSLLKRKQQAQFPHALLLTGTPGIGKRQYAIALAEALLCSQPDSEGLACGKCSACQLLKAESHPDFHLLEPEEPGKTCASALPPFLSELVSTADSVFNGRRSG